MKIAHHDFVPYKKVESLWVLTVYYNPCGYKSRRNTYDIFIRTMQLSGIKVLTVECAFGDDPFELPESPFVIKIRSKSLLWQKERLLKIGSTYLPETCKFVAWIDCDIVFENRNWARETCELLSGPCTIVQLWESCLRLEKDYKKNQKPDRVTSFAKITTKDISTMNCGRFDMHGHTGYAWAMRREIFDEVGLYEYAITGSADHFMAHALYGMYGFCIENSVKHDPVQIKHLRNWGDKFFSLTQGKLGAVSGEILHVWHGSMDRRDYYSRMWMITECGYNPNSDFLSMPGRPHEWHPEALKTKPKLVAYFAEYFKSRQEDTE